MPWLYAKIVTLAFVLAIMFVLGYLVGSGGCE
jgi:hypothetical protein